jgi:poly(3-hydroxybutyrate) depolymerase
MYCQLLQSINYLTKVRSAVKKGDYYRYHLIVLLVVFLFAVNLSAQEISIKVGSTTRDMIIYAPPGIEPNRPLVISMHGMNQTMNDQKNQTQFQSVAEANNFILVFPQAIDNSWQLWGTTDTDFILAIIDEMNTRYGIDRDRVYLSGFSMGGMMTYYAATQIADKIAAFAPVTGFLMDGPDTNSSRPIPIIHVHGMDDTYVPYDRVQECLDAWIERNGCPTTPEVIQPYPANNTGSKTSMKHWGPGIEGVEIEFLSLEGVGHWYKDDPNSVFTSQEIWNFCKKYSLKMGFPEFKYASVTESNPKQIQVNLSEEIVDSSYFYGFAVKVDTASVTIDSVVMLNTNQLIINLDDSLQKDNEITLSYSHGNVFSTSGKQLISFSDTLVDNLLKGASPRIIELTTNKNGDTLAARFNMQMQNPSDISTLALNAEYNSQTNVPILQSSFQNNDSTVLLFTLGNQVYRDYALSLTYTGSTIISKDNGILKSFSGLQVTNNSNGLPVHINSGELKTDGITLLLEFSKPMAKVSGQPDNLPLDVNGDNISIKSVSTINNTLELTLWKSIHYGDTVKLSYTPGKITAADNGPLEEFSNFVITNQVSKPTWVSIPGKIEAENYVFVSGMQAETTGDVGGGQNLGYIGDGSWVEYAIENNTSETDYQIDFRLASQNTRGIIEFYMDEIKIDTVSSPITGEWQVYQSVTKDISIPQGKHYLKVVAAKAGFNINYFDVHKILTGVPEIKVTNIRIFPNPVSEEMTINSPGFMHNQIEIFDATGNLVISKATESETMLSMPVHLANGVYVVKISNETQYQLERIIISNKQ